MILQNIYGEFLAMVKLTLLLQILSQLCFHLNDLTHTDRLILPVASIYAFINDDSVSTIIINGTIQDLIVTY